MHGGLGTPEIQNLMGYSASDAAGKNQQIDPLGGYLPSEANQKRFLNKKTQRENGQNYDIPQQQNRITGHASNNQSLNAILLDEVRKEKIKTELDKNTLNLMSRSWVMFWDYKFNLPYYYNNCSGVSQWEKPLEFASVAPQNQQLKSGDLHRMPINSNTNNFNSVSSSVHANASNKVNIDDHNVNNNINNKQKEKKDNKEVEEESLNSEEEKVKNAYFIPGLINREEFLLNEYGDELFHEEVSQSEEAQQQFGYNKSDKKLIKDGLQNVENLENRDNNFDNHQNAEAAAGNEKEMYKREKDRNIEKKELSESLTKINRN